VEKGRTREGEVIDEEQSKQGINTIFLRHFRASNSWQERVAVIKRYYSSEPARNS
jgi:hypothetical protein